MYGDKLYCMSCGNVFPDTWTMHDTRTEKVCCNCPNCKSMHTINATKETEKYETDKRGNNQYYSKTIDSEFYKVLKKKVKKVKFINPIKDKIYFRSFEYDIYNCPEHLKGQLTLGDFSGN